ncbi:MAG: hypothetical protein AUK31_05045 [Fibrobacteres bacterium CG2_30_45_31]|nr:MAG: hypothetical protein AUK31_05045 [Fibrobacteres bacterium CG2_30_45_31]
MLGDWEFLIFLRDDILRTFVAVSFVIVVVSLLFFVVGFYWVAISLIYSKFEEPRIILTLETV